jgi:hypothetical protein
VQLDYDDDITIQSPEVTPIGEALGRLYVSMANDLENLKQWEVMDGKNAMAE